MPGGTVKDCLTTIGAARSELNGCASLSEEWTLIKKAYFKKILVCHPDKGGDATVFCDVQAAFEVLRTLFDEAAVESFATAHAQSTAHLYQGSKEDVGGMDVPSWEYYDEAAKETAATYRVELARSDRSRCQARGTRKQCDRDPPFIEKGSLRVGFILGTGFYGLWVHLECWRVPSKIWLGLPDPAKCRDRRKFESALLHMSEISLCGVRELPKGERSKIVRYVMDKRHWTFEGVAEKVRKRAAGGNGETAPVTESQDADAGLELVAAKPKARERFVVPVPGRGAPAGSLAGQTFVLTGLFPEVGGGEGLQLGKERVKKMITSFGGKVASAVSGRTDFLVVGKEPGFSKLSKARKSPKTRVLSLHDMKVGLEQGSLEEVKAKPMLVKGFSRGFGRRRGGPNSLALRASEEELAIAAGTKAPALDATVAKSRSALKRPAAAPRASQAKTKVRRVRAMR